MRLHKVCVWAALACAVVLCASVPRPAHDDAITVTRATLANGLRVVVVHNPLAPVVTAIMNYRVGSDDQPVDGLAHATEHMMFRGSKTLSSSQLMDALDVTGGDFDADTQNEVTQYFFTVPAQYLDIAIRAERSRATGVLMSQSAWEQERGAITQEVTQDNSDALYRLSTKMTDRLLANTPYAKNGLGTVYGFAHVVGSRLLKRFYGTWYHPNNAIYVIVGDVDGPATIAKVKKIFGDVPAAKLPERPSVRLSPVTAAVYHDNSDQPYTAVLLGYRLPGYDSSDYEAGQILADVFNSQRGDLYALVADGNAYDAELDVQSYPKASIGIMFAAVPIATTPEIAGGWMRAIVDRYRKDGVPADLVAAAKLREISQLEFAGDSIEGLAFEWSQALAVQNLHSPNDELAALRSVTVTDVNRVLREYLDNDRVVTAYAVPKNGGATTSGGGALAKEVNTIPPAKHEPLPSWVSGVLEHLRVPANTLSPVSMRLPNGLRLIVQPEHVTHTVSVSGEILDNPQVQEPAGQEGVADLTEQLLPYGTTTYGRVALQAQLDDIAATTQVGTSFGLEVLSKSFDRGVQLLADEELHPAFDASDFAIVQPQFAAAVSDDAKAPDHLTDLAVANALYPPGDPMRRFATPESAKSLTLDDVKAWYASAYRPDLTAIVVVGDVTPAQARATIERYFGGWKAHGPRPQVYPPSVAANAPSSTIVPATGRVQSDTQLVESIGLMRRNPDWATMEVANTMLSGGFSSLLYHDLREVHGYVYYVESTVEAGKRRSTFSVEYGSDPQNIVPVEAQTIAILKTLQRGFVDPGRLLRAKARLMGDVPLRAAGYDGVADLLLNYAVQGLPLDQDLIDARRELSTTPSMIRSAMNKWVRPDGFARIVTGPAPR